jgi:hypothetical protein
MKLRKVRTIKNDMSNEQKSDRITDSPDMLKNSVANSMMEPLI